MTSRTRVRQLWTGISVAVALVMGSDAAQVPAPGFTRPASDADEVTLALSALPEPMRASATAYVLGAAGYVKKKDGSSGVACLVERSRPDTQEPICWDKEGVETIMPLTMAKAEWRAKGGTEAEVERRTSEGFASRRFRAPRRPGIAYMVSA